MITITANELFELYEDTLNRCGLFLLECNDEDIEFEIFEEFDIGIHSFFHDNSLNKIFEAGLISKIKCEKSALLRRVFIELQNTDEWNIRAIRNSKKWRAILSLADDLRSIR